MKYGTTPEPDWELLQSISSTYGKKYFQLNKKQKKEVDNTYMETMQDHDFSIQELANRWYE